METGMDSNTDQGSKAKHEPNEGRIKHLEMIQAVITKMSNNSFLIKGWCVTLVAGLLALSAKDSNHTLVFIAYLPLLMMWGMDAFFLRQERLFRKLYNECCERLGEPADFSMSTVGLERQVEPWIRVMLSKMLILFYGTMVVALLIATAVLRGWHSAIKNCF
jgi:hypothetical protein